ncbi:MAG: ThiF family adenylyltransferase [Clostridia bacterium]|nr:ThiF family adenylyltransferase [Clostridia bacterium]
MDNKTISDKELADGFHSRTKMLIGEDGVRKLEYARVAVFGAGGVGGAVIEALARAGVGCIIIIDGDTVAPSNLNRQILYGMKDIGKPKPEAARDYLRSVCPGGSVLTVDSYFRPGKDFPFAGSPDVYVVDAVDDVQAKVYIAKCCKEAGCREIAAMGAGNKLDPTKFQVADIYDTKVCPLARTMRREYRKAGIEHLKVVYSTEEPKPMEPGQEFVGSISFVPPAMGYVIASEVIKDILSSPLPAPDEEDE